MDDEINKKEVGNKLVLLEMFIKEIKDKFLPEIKKVDYEQLIEKVDDNEISNSENYDILKDLGKSILRLTENVVNAKQFNIPQLKNFSKAKCIPIPVIQEVILEMEIHLKDIYRKNIPESIELADKISRMIRINSFPYQDYDNETTPNEIKKRKFFNRNKGRY